jgi:hypothetical protein
MDTLDYKYTYAVMFFFLNDFWEQRQADYTDELPGLLGKMMAGADGIPADPTLWYDWGRVSGKQLFVPQNGYEAMLAFLRDYRLRGDSGELTALIDTLAARPEALVVAWNRWFEKVLRGDFAPA